MCGGAAIEVQAPPVPGGRKDRSKKQAEHSVKQRMKALPSMVCCASNGDYLLIPQWRPLPKELGEINYLEEPEEARESEIAPFRRRPTRPLFVKDKAKEGDLPDGLKYGHSYFKAKARPRTPKTSPPTPKAPAKRIYPPPVEPEDTGDQMGMAMLANSIVGKKSITSKFNDPILVPGGGDGGKRHVQWNITMSQLRHPESEATVPNPSYNTPLACFQRAVYKAANYARKSATRRTRSALEYHQVQWRVAHSDEHSVLNLENSRVTIDDMLGISRCLVSNKHLRRLSLRGNALNDVAASHLVDALLEFREMEHLDLAHNFGLTPLSINSLSRLIDPALVVLDRKREKDPESRERRERLGEWQALNSSTQTQSMSMVAPAGLLGVKQVMKQAIKQGVKQQNLQLALKHLLLEGNNLGDKGIALLSKSLTFNMVLEELDIRNCCFGSSGTKCISGMLMNNQTLRTLKLGGGDAGAKSLARAMHANTSLTYLDVSWSGLGEHAAAFGLALMENQVLTFLDMSKSSIRGATILLIAEGLRSNCVLRTLLLDGNPLGAAGARELIAAANIHSHLSKLGLTRCDLLHNKVTDGLTQAHRVQVNTGRFFNRETPNGCYKLNLEDNVCLAIARVLCELW
eukprot:gene6600-7902_t